MAHPLFCSIFSHGAIWDRKHLLWKARLSATASTGRALLMGALGLLGAFIGTTVTTSTATAAPFSCSPNVYLSQGPNSGQDLYELTFPGGMTDLGSPIRPAGVTSSQGTFNAIGFREEDGYIYGLDRDENLIRIESDGLHVNLGVPTGLPLLPNGGSGSNYVAGTVGPDGLYYVLSQSGAASIFVIDIDLNEVISTIPRPNTFNGADFVIDAQGHFGYLYSSNAEETRRISLTNDSGVAQSTVQRLGATTGETGTYGAAYLDANNRFFISNNSSNNVYEIDLSLNPATGLPNGTPSLVASGAFAVDRNDGAFCPGAAFPVGPPPTNAIVTTFIDVNGNDVHDPSEPFYEGGEVELEAGGDVLSTATTDTMGEGRLNNLTGGTGRRVRVRRNGRLLAERVGVDVPAGTTTEVLIPIDPSGKIYDASTRDLIAGATVTMTNASGTALPAACFSPTTQQNQVTAADGFYRFDLVPGADALCPTTETEYRIAVSATGYDGVPSSSIPPQTGPYNPVGATTNEIVPNADRPQGVDPTTYYTSFLLASSDPDVVNNHIALDQTAPAGPAFPTGPGLGASVCSVSAATNPWQDIGLRWEFNANGGTSPNPSIDRADIFASATVGSYVGINAQINNFDLNIDADSIPAAYDPNHYIQYQFTTAAFTNQAELTGIGNTVFGRRPFDPNEQATGAYRFAIAVDDDPSFASPDVLMSDVQFNGADTSTAAAATNPSDTGTYIQTFAHWDTNGTAVQLSPSTTYTMRVYPYSVTEFGDDNGQPYTNIVLWDDFMPKAVSCAQVDRDYSDAPTSGTSFGDVTHQIVNGIRLGASVDAETASIANANADGEGADDDGLTLPTMVQGQTATIAADVAGAGGYLQGWIDFDGSGSFDAGEQIATDIQDGGAGDSDGAAGTIAFDITVPAGAVTTQTFARFRWSTTTGLNATTAATDGEVEDYALTIQSSSMPPLASCAGNPPGYVDFNFTTIINDTGAGTGRTWTFPNVIDYFGESVDVNVEVLSLTGTDDFDSIGTASGGSGANTVMKALDGTGGINATEAEIQWSFVRSIDGSPIAISTEVEFGDIDLRTSRLESILVNRADYDGYSVNAGSTIIPSSDGVVDRFDGGEDADSLPSQAVKFTLINRSSFTWRQRMERLATGTDSTGRAGFKASGPPFQVNNCPRYDFSDAAVTDDARHNAFSAYTLGSAIDSELSAPVNANADGDGADDDGVTLPTLTQGETASITADVAGAGGYLQGWIDFDGSGTFDAGEQITTDIQDGGAADTNAATGTISFDVSVPANAVTTQTYARFRWSTTSGLDATTAAPDGEVEDYALTIEAAPAGPAFPPGPGLTASVCEVSAATNPWQDIGLRWEFNANGGTSPNPSIDRADIFASATVGSYVGINAQINNWDLNIDADSIPAAYDPNHYIQYQFTTAAFTNQAELTGIGNTLFGRRPFNPNEQATGAYRFAIAVDDDPAFASPDVLMSDVQFNGVDTSSAAAATGVSDTGTYLQTFAHWDTNGTTVQLSPSTTYTMRVYPYAVTEFGDDNGQPYTNVVLWDDFMPKAVSCAAATYDFSDAPGFADGGDYPSASHVIDGVTFLGTAPTPEDAAQTANGDASDDENDDGVTLPSHDGIDVLRLDEVNSITVDASVSGFLNAWIDWNQDGDFNDSGEQFATDQALVPGPNALSLTVPITTPMGENYLRFRFSTVAGIGPSGEAPDGEVEDYRVNIARPVALGVCSNVIRNNGFETPDTASFSQPLETQVDYWATIPVNPNSGSFNRMNSIEIWQSGFQGVPAYEGQQFAELNAHVSGGLYQDVITFVSPNVGWRFAHRARSGTDSIKVLIGPPGAEVEQAMFTSDTSGWQVYSGVYEAPPGQPITRFMLQAVDGGSVGNFVDAIEFYGACDFGDAPNDYATDYAAGGAYHIANSTMYLGSVFGDSEPDATVNGTATGDDTDNLADEDGVAFPASLTPGTTINLPVTVVGNGFLNAWVDWNGNNAFDDIEQIAVDVQDVAGTGTINLPVTVPADSVVGATFARFRWSSDFGIGSSGYAPDGEVEDYQVTIGNGGTVLSGQIFLDNGDGAVAHDGQIAGNEIGVNFGSLAFFDGSGNQIATPTVNPDGTWRATLPAGYSGPVELVTTAASGYRTISEDRSPVTVTNNASDTDSTYTFNVTAGSSISGMNIGLIEQPTLTQNQSSSVQPGQIVDLPHVYTATTSGTVDFALVDPIANPAGAFSSTIFEDTNCDGTPDVVVPAARPVLAGDQVCLLVRTQVSGGAGPTASYTYGLTATTAYTGTAETHVVRNDDAIGAGTGQELLLRKLVTNLTKASGEGTSNSGDIGDVLRYRIVMSNPSGEAATNVVVYDETPAYTALNGAIPSPVTVASGITCTLAVPASNVAGYSGPLQWNCPGSFPPGAEGSVTFDVQIAP